MTFAMKTYYLLSLVFILPACEKERATQPATKAQDPSGLLHPSVEFYVHEFEGQGAYSSPNWPMSGGLPPGVSFSTAREGEPLLGFTATYLKSDKGADYDEVTVALPEHQEVDGFPREVAYLGAELELWREIKYKIGMRPLNKDAN